jgi:hemoglobin-like flavoprotein
MVMMKELSFQTVSAVIESWEALKRHKDYDEFGTILFTKFFERCPEAKKVFGFDKTQRRLSNEDFYKTQRFKAHAKHFVAMLNKAVDMIGPNIEILTEILLDLGRTHCAEYGVKDGYYPIMGAALLESMEEMLGPKTFTKQTKHCWLEVYQSLTDMMTFDSENANLNL